MRRKKIAGAADYIIPLGVVVLGAAVLYKFGFFGSESGSSSSGPLLQSSSTATQQQSLAYLDQIDNWYGTQQPATNPFLPGLYQSNNSCIQISPTDAQSLWSDMYNASDPGFFFAGKNADLSGVLAQFQASVANACDLSYISTLSIGGYGSNLWDFMRKFFANDSTGTSGETNIQMFADFVVWAGALPQTGVES